MAYKWQNVFLQTIFPLCINLVLAFICSLGKALKVDDAPITTRSNSSLLNSTQWLAMSKNSLFENWLEQAVPFGPSWQPQEFWEKSDIDSNPLK